jgi:hypothetical protein
MNKKQIFERAIASLTVLNTIIVLNLVTNVAKIEYSLNALDSNLTAALQSLSVDVWNLKTGISNNAKIYSGEFE